MNLEDIPDINAAFDPETQEYLPLSHAAQWWCENLFLPTLEEEYAAAKPNRRASKLNEALQLIALHQVAPSPWLASMMLKKFKVKPHKQVITVEKAREVWLKVKSLKAENKISLDDCAAEIGVDPNDPDCKSMSPATLDRLLKFYREHEARLKRLADKLP